MATLSNPRFEIDLLTGSPTTARVISTVNVQLDQFDKFLLSGGINFELQPVLWGEDGTFFNGGDDKLYTFPGQRVTGEGVYTFTQTINRKLLDEDNGNDEVYSRFNLVSKNNSFPLNISVKSPTITGNF